MPTRYRRDRGGWMLNTAKQVGWAMLMAWGVCSGPARAATTPAMVAAGRVPLDQIPTGFRENVRSVLARPTLYSAGPRETFHGSPPLYQWLLDHPDEGVRIWRRLGAHCMDITKCGEGRFGWCDDQGSSVIWETLVRTPSVHLWYATGSVRPGPLLPMVPVRVVVILRSQDSLDATGRTLIRHQAELFLYTDSTTAALAAKLIGPTGPQLAEQCLAQLELFFSALVWYADKHPERVKCPEKQPSDGPGELGDVNPLE